MILNCVSIYNKIKDLIISGSIVVSIPACHAGDRGSIPRSRGYFSLKSIIILKPLMIDLYNFQL